MLDGIIWHSSNNPKLHSCGLKLLSDQLEHYVHSKGTILCRANTPSLRCCRCLLILKSPSLAFSNSRLFLPISSCTSSSILNPAMTLLAFGSRKGNEKSRTHACNYKHTKQQIDHSVVYCSSHSHLPFNTALE